MEQNSRNLIKGILTGCLIAVIAMSLATKAHADEIIDFPGQNLENIEPHALVPTIYFGSRHAESEERDIWALGYEGPTDEYIISGHFTQDV